MDSDYSAIASGFGAVDTRFLAQGVVELDPQIPLCVPKETTIQQSISLMQQKKIGSIVVVDDKGKICGIFSERDMLMKVALKDAAFYAQSISSVMTANPHCESMETTIAFALHAMVEGGYRHLPLVDAEGCPTGIISIKDIAGFIEGEIVRQLAMKELGV